MKRSVLHVFGLVLVLFAAASATETAAQSISGSIANGTVTRGKAARATVVLSIPGGLHANSNRPGSEYAIPTTVRASSSGAKIGSVTYPRGVNRKFSFSESTINVYEGRPKFTFNVTVPANSTAKTIRINVSVRYQACNDEVCYPPKTKEMTMTAKVL